MSATQIKRTVLEMSNSVDVNNRQTQVTNPWYIDYAVCIPKPLPNIYTRELYYTITCFELRDGCILNNVPDNKLLPVTKILEAAPKQLIITVTEDEFNDALAGNEGNVGILVVTKLVAALAVIFEGNYATVKNFEINITDPDNPVITDVTP